MAAITTSTHSEKSARAAWTFYVWHVVSFFFYSRIILMGFSAECACFIQFYIRDLRGFYVTSTSSSSQHTTHMTNIYFIFLGATYMYVLKRDKLGDAVANMKYAREHRIALCGDWRCCSWILYKNLIENCPKVNQRTWQKKD